MFPDLKYRYNKKTDIRCSIRFKKGLNIWHKEKHLYESAASILNCKPFEVIMKKATIKNDKAEFVIDRNFKYKVEVGAKVLVLRSSSEQIETTIKNLDTEFQLIKVEEFKELPFAFQNVRFLETVKIESNEKKTEIKKK